MKYKISQGILITMALKICNYHQNLCLDRLRGQNIKKTNG